MRPLVISLLFYALATTTALSAGEHGRRAAAELEVLAGDASRLSSDRYQDIHKEGLNDRLFGSLSGLEILLRLADQEAGRASTDTRREVKNLRAALREKRINDFQNRLAPLRKRHALPLTGILPLASSRHTMAQAKDLHERLCAGCHDEPVLDVERPAYNLYTEAKTLSLESFAARMIIGVRGDAMTGISNPLTDSQISALISYYKTVTPVD